MKVLKLIFSKSVSKANRMTSIIQKFQNEERIFYTRLLFGVWKCNLKPKYCQG